VNLEVDAFMSKNDFEENHEIWHHLEAMMRQRKKLTDELEGSDAAKGARESLKQAMAGIHQTEKPPWPPAPTASANALRNPEAPHPCIAAP